MYVQPCPYFSSLKDCQEVLHRRPATQAAAEPSKAPDGAGKAKDTKDKKQDGAGKTKDAKDKKPDGGGKSKHAKDLKSSKGVRKSKTTK